MSRLTRKRRQEIIYGYLHESGANQYVPEEFIDWLSERPEHVAYQWFEWDDTKAAAAHRADQARHFASGCRVTFTQETVGSGGRIKVSQTSMPAMISPHDNRRHGGGYVPLAQDDPVAMEAFCDEAARALDAWCRRYEAAVMYRRGNSNAVRKLVALLTPPKADAA